MDDIQILYKSLFMWFPSPLRIEARGGMWAQCYSSFVTICTIAATRRKGVSERYGHSSTITTSSELVSYIFIDWAVK